MFTIPPKSLEETVKDSTVELIKVALDSVDSLVTIYETVFRKVWSGSKEEIQGRFDLLGVQGLLLFQGAQVLVNAILIGKPDYVPPPAKYEYSFTAEKVVVGNEIQN